MLITATANCFRSMYLSSDIFGYWLPYWGSSCSFSHSFSWAGLPGTYGQFFVSFIDFLCSHHCSLCCIYCSWDDSLLYWPRVCDISFFRSSFLSFFLHSFLSFNLLMFAFQFWYFTMLFALCNVICLCKVFMWLSAYLLCAIQFYVHLVHSNVICLICIIQLYSHVCTNKGYDFYPVLKMTLWDTILLITD